MVCHLYLKGPKIDPWGTSQESFHGSQIIWFKITLSFLFDKYDLNQRMLSLENPKNSNLLIRISWLIVSNTFWTSMSIMPVQRPYSKQVVILLFRYEIHNSVKTFS